MKKFSLKVAVLLLSGSVLFSSCIGSFALFNKYEKWQCNMTSVKIVNGIVGLILQPIVGTVCLTVDALVLNTIEFWSGNNPLAMNTVVEGKDGNLYTIKSTKKGYEVTDQNGAKTLFTHDAKNDSWSVSQNGKTVKMFQYNTDGTIEANLPSGKTITVTNDEAGLNQVKEAVFADTYYAMR